MVQKNIDFGSFPDDPSADAIRTAFEKTQDNFNQLFQGLADGTVTSVNKTPGAGISVNSPVGDVIISADYAQLQIHTSTLSLGIGSNGGQDVTINNSSQLLYIDLPQTISNVVNINLSGNLLASGNISACNAISSNIIIAGTGTFSDINVSGNVTANSNVSANILNANNSIIVGLLNVGSITTTGNANVGILNAPTIVGTDLTISNTTNTNTLLASTANVGNVNVTGNVTSNNLISNSITVPNIVSGNSNIILVNNGNVTVSSGGNANILVVTDTDIHIKNNVSVSGNAIAQNFIGNISGNFSGNIVLSGSNTELLFNNDGSIASNARLTFNKALNVLSVSGNANIGNINGGNQQLTGNLLMGSGTGGTFTGANLVNANYFTGTLTTANQPNITNVGTLGSLSVSGNSNLNAVYANTVTTNGSIYSNNASLGNLVVANYFSGDGSLLTNLNVSAGSSIINGTSNVVVANSGNVTTSVNGTSNVLKVTSSGINVTGTINSTGNISAPIVNTSFLYGNLVGSVDQASQPNITSLGILTSLTVNGTANLGSVSNVKITGGSNNFYLTTDGSGGLSWTSGSFSPTGGSNTSIQYNDAGSFGGDSNFTYNKATKILTLSGNITASNANLGNLIIGNYVQGTLTTAAQPNITSVGALSSLIVSGNINTGNVFGGNTLSANYLTGVLTTASQPNITSLGTLSGVTSNASPAFTAGSAAASNVSYQMADNSSIRNYGISTIMYYDAGVGPTSPGGTHAFRGSNAYTNYAIINSSGLSVTGNITGSNLVATSNLVIGASTTSQKLEVIGTNGNVQIDQTGDQIAYTRDGYNYLTAIAANATLQIQTSGINGTIIFATANVERLRITSAGVITGSGNATFGNISTAGLITATGNATFGNISTAGLFTATGNVIGGNLITTGIISATGNVIGGNLITTGIISATGNITGNYFIGDGSQLTNVGVAAANITGNTLSSNVTVSSLTSIGTLGYLSVSGSANFGTTYFTQDVTFYNSTYQKIKLYHGNGAIITGDGLYPPGYGGVIKTYATGNVCYIQTGLVNSANSSAPLKFTNIDNGNTWMMIDAAGNVGINTISPTSKLHVVGTANVTDLTATGNANIVTSLTLPTTLSQAGGAPLTATDTTISHKIPIIINGVTYYISLTTSQ